MLCSSLVHRQRAMLPDSEDVVFRADLLPGKEYLGLAVKAAGNIALQPGMRQQPSEDAVEFAALIVNPPVSEPSIKKVSHPEIMVGAATSRFSKKAHLAPVSIAFELLAANGNLPSLEELRSLTGYSRATVSRYYPNQSEASTYRSSSPSALVTSKSDVPGSKDFFIRLGWPSGKALPSKVTILLG
jgi:hypothetical protein